MGRRLEPEVMETAEEAAAYDELDRRFGEILFQGFALSALNMGIDAGRVLDVGTGPGRIAIRLARLNPALVVEGIDLSRSMLALAEQNAERAGVSSRVRFTLGDAKRIPFPDGTFDMVICHNMLHQLPEPLITVKEIVRVAKPEGAILIRDVRRLSSPIMNLVLPFYCIGYSPILRRLTYDSYRAGLTYDEFAEMTRAARIRDARLQKHFITHVSVARPARPHRPGPATSPAESLLIRLMRWPYVSHRRS